MKLTMRNLKINGGRVFFIYSIKSGKKKKIYNIDVIEEIRNEIERLKKN